MEQQAFTTADADLIGTASGNDRGEIRLWERRVRYQYMLLLIQFKFSFVSSAEPPCIQSWPYPWLRWISSCDNNAQHCLVCYFTMETAHGVDFSVNPLPKNLNSSDNYWKGFHIISKFLSPLFTCSINMYMYINYEFEFFLDQGANSWVSRIVVGIRTHL